MILGNDNRISVNLIAGSGTFQGKGSWIFSAMSRRIMEFIDPDEFDIVVTETPDMSRQYDVYHYLHSTLAVQHEHCLHRSLVTVVALDDIAPHRTFASKEQTLKKCRRISTICRDVRNSLISQGVPGEMIDYTPLGTDLEAFAPTGENREDILARCECMRDPSMTRIGIIGRSYPDGRKGEKFLSLVMEDLSNENVCFVFIGQWDAESIVPDMISYENHIVDVDCSYEDYPDLYETLDGVIVTSKTEAGPACILEALAKGLPVISTPGGMANEFLTRRIVDDEFSYLQIGKVIPYGDVHGFVEAIEDIIIEQSTLSIESRQMVAGMLKNEIIAPSVKLNDDHFKDEYPYSWENWSRRFQRIYKEIASEVKSKRFFQDFVGEDVIKQVDATFHERVQSSLPDTYLTNFMHNMDYVKRGLALKDFVNVLGGKPAIIIGVGPSLNDDIALIKEYQDDVVIFACDAAIPVLEKNGITPHVVVVADPSDRQIPNFTGRDCSGFLTVMPSIVHPMVFHESRKADCKVAWYNIEQDDSLICHLIPIVTGMKGGLVPGVLTTGMAMQVAMFMGCYPLTFVGHDLGWYDVNGDGYATGVDEAKIIFQKSSKMGGGDVLVIDDVNGNKITTELNFFVFAQWVNRFLHHNNIKVHNSSQCGILYGENIIQLPLYEWLERFSSRHNAKADLMERYFIFKNAIEQQCCHQYGPHIMELMRSL